MNDWTAPKKRAGHRIKKIYSSRPTTGLFWWKNIKERERQVRQDEWPPLCGSSWIIAGPLTTAVTITIITRTRRALVAIHSANLHPAFFLLFFFFFFYVFDVVGLFRAVRRHVDRLTTTTHFSPRGLAGNFSKRVRADCVISSLPLTTHTNHLDFSPFKKKRKRKKIYIQV